MLGPGTYLWSADGNYNVSADGYPGWSADGYEPVALAVAIKALANAGSYVTSITYVANSLVPPGYVITGFVPYLTTPGPVALEVSAYPPRVANMVYVPDTVGMFYYDAQLAILDAGLLIAPPNLVISSLVLPQYVISQSLKEGTQVAQQTPMTITVSAFTVVQQPGIPTPVL
jgi:beta-lactam-binding protein with PASTA domain